ncbi:hypothetical protein CPB97_011316, partial [Podila verticillata]
HCQISTPGSSMDKKFEEFLVRIEARIEVGFESMIKNLETRVKKTEVAFEMDFDVIQD